MANALGIDDSYSVSYIVVGDSDQKEGFQKVLATACPFEVVDCYKRVFNMLQINLRSVMIGCNCITKVLLSDTKAKSKMPLLAVQIDNNFISLNLYENQQLSFSRFASISAEDYDGNEDYVYEAVLENINRMTMFQRSKIGSDQIENVVFYGDTREYVRLTQELEKMAIQTSIINVPPQIHGYENLEFSSYANAIGAMFRRDKEKERINLLETDTVNNNRIRSDSSYYMILLVSVLASVAICFVAWFILTMKNTAVEKEIKVLTEKQNSTLCQQLKDQIIMLTEKQTAVNTYLEGITDADNAYTSQVKPTSKHYILLEDAISETLMDVLEIEDEEEIKEKYYINSVDYSNGQFKLEFAAIVENDLPLSTFPSKLVRKLRSLPEVLDVPYEGYAVESIDAYDQFKSEDGEDKIALEDYRVVGMSLVVSMKGGEIDMAALSGEEG
jgi:type IV pilus assembly protein PilM